MFKDKDKINISKEKLQELRQAYVQIVQESNKAEEAQSKFLKLLKEENITINATEYIMQGLKESYGIYSNSLNNDTRSIATLTKEQKRLNGELEKAPKAEQQINIQREKTLQTLQATEREYNSAVYSVEALALAQAHQAEEEFQANQQMQEQETRINSLRSAIGRWTDNFEEASQATQEAMEVQEKYNETFEQIKSRISYILSLSNAYNILRNIVRETFQDVQELDKAFASIAMVTDKTVKELWTTYDDYSSIANKLGQTTESAIKASALYYQQGLDTADALRLTENTMKLATLAGADFEKSTQYMTSALRGFRMEMTEGAHVTDVYSQLAANAAADVKGIAYSMSKTASIANSAGMSFETTAAFLTNMIETTQEAPENLGTALKTVIARFTELKENVSATESEFDDLDYNKVDKALKSVGINLKDAQGQFRDLDDVFLELSSHWSSLDRNTQRYIATTAAGSRQQSRFLALMENYERTMELVETAQNSAGRSTEQFAKYQDTVEYKLNQLKNSWEQFRTSLIETDVFKTIIEGLTKLVQLLQKFNFKDPFTIFTTGGGIAALATSLKTSWKGISKTISAGGDALGEMLGDKIAQGLKGNLNIEKKLSEITKKKINFNNIIEDNSGVIEEKRRELQELEKALEDLKRYEGFGDSLIPSMIEDKSTEINNTKQQINELGTEIKKYEQKLKSLNQTEKNLQKTGTEKGITFGPGVIQGLQLVGSQIGIIASMLRSGASASEIFFTSFTTGISQVIPQFIKLISTEVQLSNVTRILKTDLDQEKRAHYEATKAELAQAAASNTLAFGIAIVAAAITGIIYLSLKAREEWKNTHKTVSEQLESTKKQLEEIEQKTTAAKNAAREAQDEYKNISKIKDEYDSLSNKLVKTTEEQEQWNELVSKIAEEYPEIVSYYDEANNKIEVQKDLWEDIIQLQKENAKQAQQSAAIAAAGEYAVRAYQAQLIGQSNIETTSRNLLQDKEGQKILNQIKGTNLNNLTVKSGRSILNSYKDADLTRLLGYFGYTQESLTSVEDYQKLFAEMADENSKGWQMAEQELDAVKKNAENMERTQSQYYQQMTEQALASSLTAGGMDSGIANLMAKAVSEGTRQGIDSSTTGLKTYSLKDVQEKGLSWSSGWRYGAAALIGGGIDPLHVAGAAAGVGIANYFLENDIAAWDELKKEERDILTELGYEREEWNKTDRKNLATDKTFIAKFNAVYTQQKAADAALIVSTELESNSALNDAFKEYTSTYMDLTGDEIGKKAKELSQLINDTVTDEESKTALLNMVQQSGYVDSLNNIKNNLANMLSSTAKRFDNWTYNEVSAFDAWVQNNLNLLGTTRGSQYSDQILSSFENKGFTGTQINNLLNSFDFSQATATTWDSFQESAISSIEEIFGYTEEEATEFFNQFAEDAKEYGVLNITIKNDQELQDFLDKLKEFSDNVASLEDDLVKLEAQVKAGDFGLDYDTYANLKERLSAVGKDIQDYTSIDDQGNIAIKNAEALKNLYKDLLDENKQKILDQIKENELRNEQLKQENSQLDLTMASIKSQFELNGQLADGVNYYVQMNNKIIDLIDTLRKLGVEVSGDFERGKLVKGPVQDVYDEIYKVYEERRIANKAEIEANEETIKKLYEQYDLADKEELAQLKSHNEDVLEEYDKLTKDEVKKVEDASEKVLEAEKKVEEATKKLYETLYGTEFHKNKLDALYNYTSMLEEIQRQITKTKEKIDDFTTEDLSGSLSDYEELLRKESSIYQAERRVYEQSNANYREQLNSGIAAQIKRFNSIGGYNIDSDISKYYYSNPLTGLLDVNFDALNAANLPDEISDLIESVIDEINKGTKKIQEIDDAMEKRQKELKEFGEKVVDGYVKVEDEVIKVLKDKYKEEIDANKAKNDAMAESDNEYLDALEAAIKKQRDLRDRQNQWETLAQKERKAALLQRDTSGANAAELRNLTEEIESDREKLLDDTVDDILNNLKEMYELQKEQREEELEFLEQTLDEQAIIREAVQTIESWESTEDAVAWMIENNKEVSEMSDAKLEQQMREWEELYNAANLYYNYDGSSIQSALDGNFEEVESIYTQVSEAQTAEAERIVGDAGDKVSKDIQDAKKALEDAQKSLEEALNEQTEVLRDIANKTGSEGQDSDEGNWGKLGGTISYGKDLAKAQAVAANLAQQGAGKAYKNIRIQERNGEYYVRYDEGEGREAVSSKLGDVQTTNIPNSVDKKAYGSKAEAASALEALGRKNPTKAYMIEQADNGIYFITEKKKLGYTGKEYAVGFKNDSKMDSYKYAIDLGNGYFLYHNNTFKEKEYIDAIARMGYTTPEKGKEYRRKERSKSWSNGEATGNFFADSGYYDTGVLRYASGGLVNYTGPAWVDGSPSRPEAFLSSEDTQRIGVAAKLLASLPFFNSSIPDSLSQIIGDTNIEVHINVDSIASDYDVDQAVERVKKDILDAARPVGSSIILNR